MTRWTRFLSPLALLASMGLVAQSEWSLALAVGWPAWVAWLAPVALDAYVIGAVVNRRDMAPAILVSAVSVIASHSVYAAPAAWSSGVIGQGHLRPELAAACSVVPLLVAWRIHHIDAAGQQARTASATRKAKASPVAGASATSAAAGAASTVARPVAGVAAAPGPVALVGRPVATTTGQTGPRAKPRDLAIADAERFRTEHGRLPTLGELKAMGPDGGHAQRTAQRALADLEQRQQDDEQPGDRLGEVA